MTGCRSSSVRSAALAASVAVAVSMDGEMAVVRGQEIRRGHEPRSATALNVLPVRRDAGVAYATLGDEVKTRRGTAAARQRLRRAAH